METGTTITLTEFERQTLSYVLFALTQQSKVMKQDDVLDDDVCLKLEEYVSREECAALITCAEKLYAP